MAVVRRIGVFSLAKIMGAVYAALGLIIGAFMSLFALVGGFMGAAGSEQGAVSAIIGMIFGVGAIILLPIVYGIAGFVGGAITSFIYNIVAGAVGGVEIDLE